MKDIIGYEEYYKISKEGMIFSIRSNKFLKLNYKKSGYVYIELNKNGVANTHRVHRLVAEAFIPNPDNKTIVHHKNNVKSDNRVSNLEWVSVSENTKRAYDDGLIKLPNTRLYQLLKDGIVIRSFIRGSELSKEIGYSTSSIYSYINSQESLRRGAYKGCTIISKRV